MEKKKNVWFRYAGKSEGKSGNIFCFPHAGSSASFFARWKSLAANNCIFPIQYPGRENRRSEPYPESIEKLAYEFVNDELETLSSKPYILFGHCMGSLVAWEVAKEMKRRGEILPEAIIVSSSVAPSRGLIHDVSNMSDDEAIESLCKLGYISRDIVAEKEFFDYYMSVMKTDRTLLESYNYDAQKDIRFDCRIITFNGEKDDSELISQALEWKNFTVKSFEQVLFGGGHFYLSEDPAAVVKRIETYF